MAGHILGQRIAVLSTNNNSEEIVFLARALLEERWLVYATIDTFRFLFENGCVVCNIADIAGPSYCPVYGRPSGSIPFLILPGVRAENSYPGRQTLVNLKVPFVDLIYFDLSSSLQCGSENSESGPSQLLKTIDDVSVACLFSAAKSGRIVGCSPSQVTDMIRIIKGEVTDEVERARIMVEFASMAMELVSDYAGLVSDFLYGQSELLRQKVPTGAT